jgi:hypothetical protein
MAKTATIKKDSIAEANERAAKKAAELSASLNCKVHPLVFQIGADGDIVIGYVKEPSRQVKLAVMDKALLYPMSSVAEVLPSIIIENESDPRILSEDSDNDKYFIGACNVVYGIIQLAANQFKKK